MLSLFTLTSFAQSTLESCEANGVNFNSKTQVATSISSDCATLIEGARNNINEDNSVDDFIYITGYKNILYTKEYILDIDNNKVLNADRFTAGEETNLKDIVAVDFNEADASIYLLNKVNSDTYLQSFYYNVSGNISPLKSFTSVDLNHASNLRVDDTSGLIFVVFKDLSTIKAFYKEANPNGNKSENSTDIVREIQGAATTLQSPIDIAIVNNELFVLDNNRILVFNLTDNGSIAPKRSIQGTNTNLSNAKRIEINSSNELEVTNGDDSILRFNKENAGNIAPL